MQDLVVSHHDQGMSSEGGQQRDQNYVADLDAVIVNRIGTLKAKHLIQIKIWIFPEPVGSSVVAELHTEVLVIVLSDNRVAIMLALHVLEAKKVTEV